MTMPAGFGEIDQPGIGTKGFHLFADIQDDGDGAKSFEKAARPVGFLSDHTVFKEGSFHPMPGREGLRPGTG